MIFIYIRCHKYHVYHLGLKEKYICMFISRTDKYVTTTKIITLCFSSETDYNCISHFVAISNTKTKHVISSVAHCGAI